MTSIEIERILDLIAWPDIDVDNIQVPLILYVPTPKVKAKSARLYAKALQKARIAGLSDEKQAIANCIKIGFWSEQDEEQIQGLKDDIHNIKRGLLDFLFRPEQLERSRVLLRNAEFTLFEKLTARQELLSETSEAHALMVQQRYIISQITHKENGEKFWSTDEDFDDFSDFNLINSLCDVFFRKSRLNAKTIRFLSRSSIWRSIWTTGQKLGNIFNASVVELSENQLALLHWSSIYDSVYEAYERPPTDLIEDDDLLDSWFIRQGEKIESKANKQRGEDSLPNPSRKGGRNEQFIMADKEGASKVYGMNDGNARRAIKQKQKIIQNEGSVKEQHLPDSKNEIRQIAMAQSRKHALRKK